MALVNINLDGKKRKALLGWLKRGLIDVLEYEGLLVKDKKQTEEEHQKDIDRFYTSQGFGFCRRCRRLGLCKKESGGK